MKIPGNRPIFYLWPIQKLLHLGIPNRVPNTRGHTSNLWGKCPLYGGNATGRLISWEIHYRPLGWADCLGRLPVKLSMNMNTGPLYWPFHALVIVLGNFNEDIEKQVSCYINILFLSVTEYVLMPFFLHC